MISPASTIHSGFAPNAQAPQSGKPLRRQGEAQPNQHLSAPVSTPAAVQNLSLIPSIQTEDQAAVAVQAARLLIQSNSQVALQAQANPRSQSVERLLQ